MHTSREVCSEHTSRFLRSSSGHTSTSLERYLYFAGVWWRPPLNNHQDLVPHGATAQPIAQWPFFFPPKEERKSRLSARFGVDHATGIARRRDRESNERSLWRDPRERSPPQRRPRNSRSWHSPTRRKKPDRQLCTPVNGQVGKCFANHRRELEPVAAEAARNRDVRKLGM